MMNLHVPVGNAAPEFYAIELITTKNVPGSGLAVGVAEIVFAPSPFGVSLTENGDYLQDIAVKVNNLRAPRKPADPMTLSPTLPPSVTSPSSVNNARRPSNG